MRPLPLYSDGRYLYVLNAADDPLEIFDKLGETPRPGVSPRPVALALRGKQAWVVNDIFDSVTMVDIGGA